MNTERSSVVALPRIESYAEATEIVHSDVFRQAKDADVALSPIKAHTLNVLNGEAHRQRRRVETPLFRHERLLHFERDVLDRAIEEQLRVVAGHRDAQGRAHWDLIELARRAVLTVTADLIGLDGLEEPSTRQRLAEYASIFATGAVLQFKLGPSDEERRESLEAEQRFREDLFLPSWNRRRALVAAHRARGGSTRELPQDLITFLLWHLPDLTSEAALHEAMLFIHASSDTSSMAVASSVHGLAEWLPDHPEYRDRLIDPAFLQAVAFEAVRLHPPPGLLRAATEDVVLSSGRTIATGERVFIDLPCVNRDRATFGDDAEDFNPRRRLAGGVKPYGLGFGGGAHVCIGKQMAVAHRVIAASDMPDDAVGAVVRILVRLYEAGVVLDESRPPRLREGWLQERYVEFPVVFEKLPDPAAASKVPA